MSILRAVGARGWTILGLLVSEAALIACLGAVMGVVVLYGGLSVFGPTLEARFGISPARALPGLFDLYVVLGLTVTAALLGLIPAISAMRRSVADGLAIRF
jgi:putative ABC transport system permease protein